MGLCLSVCQSVCVRLSAHTHLAHRHVVLRMPVAWEVGHLLSTDDSRSV